MEPIKIKLKRFYHVQCTTDKVGRILRKYKTKTIYLNASLQKVDQLLRTLKDKLALHTSGVYRLQCSCGDCYIGETGRLDWKLQESKSMSILDVQKV